MAVISLTALAWFEFVLMLVSAAAVASRKSYHRFLGAWSIASLLMVVQWRSHGHSLMGLLFPW